MTVKAKKQISVRLTEAELARLNKAVAKSGLSREAYLRKIAAGIIPNDALPPEYFEAIRQLAAIGNNINQIARAANMTGEANQTRLSSALAELSETLTTIKRAAHRPEKKVKV